MSLVHEYGRVEFERGRHGVNGWAKVDQAKLWEKSGELRDRILHELKDLDKFGGNLTAVTEFNQAVGGDLVPFTSPAASEGLK
jgi:hypothetical protein